MTAFGFRHARRSLLGLLFGLGLTSGAARGQPVPAARSAEPQIKATFICKFGNYVEWPPGAWGDDGTFPIGAMAGDRGVAELVRAASGVTVNGRPIAVRKLSPGDPVDGLAIVFVAREHSAALTEALAPARGLPVLTVTEADVDGGAGGIVNFVVVDDKVRFDIALPAAEQSHLKISGRLLAVARKVIGRPS
jgi:hypothetical protein